MVGVTIEQVIIRGGTVCAAAMAAHLIASFMATRRQYGGLGQYIITAALSLSYALVLLGASILASYSTALALRSSSLNLHEEIFTAICIVGWAGGLYAGAFGAMLSTKMGCKLAGAPIKIIDISNPFRFRRVDFDAQLGRREIPRSEADQWYGFANKVSWGLWVFVIGSCLWHDAPSWFLFTVSVIIALSTLIVIMFKPSLLSPESLESAANSNLLMLTCFAPLGLALRAMSRFELVDWQWPLIVAAVIGWPSSFLQSRFIPVRSASRIATILLASFFCFTGSGSLVWSGILFANNMTKPALTAVHQIHISGRHEQHNKGSNMYWVNADNPPDMNGIKDFKLERSAYEQLSVGDNACIEVWSGALSLRWYRVARCKAQEPLG